MFSPLFLLFRPSTPSTTEYRNVFTFVGILMIHLLFNASLLIILSGDFKNRHEEKCDRSFAKQTVFFHESQIQYEQVKVTMKISYRTDSSGIGHTCRALTCSMPEGRGSQPLFVSVLQNILTVFSSPQISPKKNRHVF